MNAGAGFTDEQLLMMMKGPPSQLRDTIRRTWLRAQTDDELLYWIGVAAHEVGDRHGKTEAQVLAELTKLGILQDAAAAAAAKQAETS